MASSHIVPGMWSENHRVRRIHNSYGANKSLIVKSLSCLARLLTFPSIEVNVLYVSTVYVYSSLYAFMCFLEVSSWIVCDGDIDPEWIESLNSVLDDNRLLTMPSGERIQFGPNVNFLFETHDLSCASPATISRMGMIFLRSVSLCRQFLSVYLYQIPTFSTSLSHCIYLFFTSPFSQLYL